MLFLSVEVCSPECLNGGICQNGVCDCPANWEGDHCQTREYIDFPRGRVGGVTSHDSPLFVQ